MKLFILLGLIIMTNKEVFISEIENITEYFEESVTFQ